MLHQERFDEPAPCAPALARARAYGLSFSSAGNRCYRSPPASSPGATTPSRARAPRPPISCATPGSTATTRRARRRTGAVPRWPGCSSGCGRAPARAPGPCSGRGCGVAPARQRAVALVGPARPPRAAAGARPRAAAARLRAPTLPDRARRATLGRGPGARAAVRGHRPRCGARGCRLTAPPARGQAWRQAVPPLATAPGQSLVRPRCPSTGANGRADERAVHRSGCSGGTGGNGHRAPMRYNRPAAAATIPS